MSKAIVVGCTVLLSVYGYAQNVGIGTTAPTSRLHVVGGSQIIENPLNTSTFLTLRSGTNNGLIIETISNGSLTTSRLRPLQGGGASAGISIAQNNYVGMGVVGTPQYPLHIHATSDALSTSGIAFTHSGLGDSPDNGMKIGLQLPANTALQSGFIQWPGFLSFHFLQGNATRMSIDANGNINVGAPVAEARLHVRSDNLDGAAMVVENRFVGGGSPKGISVSVRDGLGVAIDARAENTDGTATPIELTTTAIRAAAGNNRNAISAYAGNGTAIRARASSIEGYALHTTGRLKFDGSIGEPATGKVLTSDAAGNATWQDVPLPKITRLENNLNFFTLFPDGRATLEGSHLLLRSGPAPAPITNPIASDGLYFFWNSGRAAVRAGQFTFSQLRHDSIGNYSQALGQRVMAKNDNSIAIGKDARAIANLAHAYGNDIEARSFREIALGSFNELSTPLNTTSWNANDRLLVVGNGSSNANRNNALVILKNGNTGIGINSPVAPVHVNSRLVIERPTSGAATTAALEWRSDGAYRGALGWDVNAARFFFYDGKSNTNTMFINNGRIGIQRDPTTNALEVNGNASKSSAGDWLANSDARLKKNMAPIRNPLEQVQLLNGITYEWNDNQTGTERPKGSQMGFTAQNIQQVFPQLVSTDAQGFLQTAYGTYDALYVEAIKALVKKVETLEAEIKLLKAR